MKDEKIINERIHHDYSSIHQVLGLERRTKTHRKNLKREVEERKKEKKREKEIFTQAYLSGTNIKTSA